MAVHCVKIILGELVLINLCRPALGVWFFMKHSVSPSTKKLQKD